MIRLCLNKDSAVSWWLARRTTDQGVWVWTLTVVTVMVRVKTQPKSPELSKRGRANSTEISWQTFRKIRKLLIFRNANHSTENWGNSRRKINWNGNSRLGIFENLSIPRAVVLFPRKFSKSCSVRLWNFLGIQTGLFWLGKRKEGVLMDTAMGKRKSLT